MMKKNPFTVSFARQPYEYIPRVQQIQLILDTFTMDPVTDQVFIIKGVRGSGKTVLMNSVASELENTKDWIVIKIIPQDDILHALYSDLYYNSGLGLSRRQMKSLRFTIDTGIFGVSGESGEKQNIPEPNLVENIRNLMKAAQKKKKKVLICIDEISNTTQMAAFSSALQLLIGDGLPVYFIGTGVYENIEDLKNVKNLTFLYRAPVIDLTPLNIGSIAESYQKIFEISADEAFRMASLTKGYSFAYQSLGYVYWEERNEKKLAEMMPEFDHLLADGAYQKIWEELSQNDKKAAVAIARQNGAKTKDIRASAGMDSNVFSTYRQRLKKKGLLDSSTYGYISFSLPRFENFVMIQERIMTDYPSNAV